jgi:hypothetical protein
LKYKFLDDNKIILDSRLRGNDILNSNDKSKRITGVII